MDAVRFFHDPETARQVRGVLDDAGFTLDALTERLGPQVFAHLSGGELAPLHRATRAADALDTLLRLFVIGVPVSLASARKALAPVPVEMFVTGGVVSVNGDEAESLIGLRPLGGPEHWVVAHDFAPTRGRPIATDHVLGVSASTMALAGATIRRPIRAAFDLGTGCGVQALYASSHSERVVASDLNQRAVSAQHVDHGAQRRHERLGAIRQPVRARRAGDLRARRRQSAVCHLTVAAVPVP